MYNYDFKNNEIINEIVENLVSINSKEFIANIIVTKNKILIFENILRNTVLSGRGIYEMPQYELILEINLDEIKYRVDDNNTIININENEVIIYSFNLKNIKLS